MNFVDFLKCNLLDQKIENAVNVPQKDERKMAVKEKDQALGGCQIEVVSPSDSDCL